MALEQSSCRSSPCKRLCLNLFFPNKMLTLSSHGLLNSQQFPLGAGHLGHIKSPPQEGQGIFVFPLGSHKMIANENLLAFFRHQMCFHSMPQRKAMGFKARCSARQKQELSKQLLIIRPAPPNRCFYLDPLINTPDLFIVSFFFPFLSFSFIFFPILYIYFILFSFFKPLLDIWLAVLQLKFKILIWQLCTVVL